MQKCKFIFLTLLITILSFSLGYSQEYSILKGNILDEENKPLPFISLQIKNVNIFTTTDINGYFSMSVPANVDLQIEIVAFNLENKQIKLNLKPNEIKNIKIIANKKIRELKTVEINANLERHTNLTPIDPKLINALPNISKDISAILPAIGLGVSKRSELTNQYSVRGGNFDENLVYVNDIEIYRPQLIRSGQQEGLSFVNTDMVQNILFSSGGFDAKYGDKMSSVLDVQYKKPREKLAGSFEAGLLGASAHFQGASNGYRFTHITGIRYKSAKALLQKTDTKGEYSPTFLDIQTFLTYDINEKLEISLLGNLSQNTYKFIPESRITEFGTMDNTKQFKIYFDGSELDKFFNLTSALSLNYNPKNNINLKLIASNYYSNEKESFDILGEYYLDELDKGNNSNTSTDTLKTTGVGSNLSHARNYLTAKIYSITHKAAFDLKKHNIVYGITYKNEYMSDYNSEWNKLDSAGYSIPYDGNIIALNDAVYTKNKAYMNRYSAFLQDTYSFDIWDSIACKINAGIRASYFDFNDEFLFSPRINFSIKPSWKNDFIFKLSAGIYDQSPFYKELRNLQAELNQNIKSQKSMHFILGTDYIFKAWDRPFKFVTEFYYKKFDDLIPYEIDNVRIRYYGQNNSSGYAAGVDFRINGEFVKNAESWASISIMQTEENIEGDKYKGQELGYIPRPTDQRFSAAIFFQDYLPNSPTWKVNLNLVFGTSVPFAPPKELYYRDKLRTPNYKRVDIGFSKILVSDETKFKLKGIKSFILTAEIFNLLDANNTISYLWIRTVQNENGQSGRYAIPNYLTGRRLNFKLVLTF